MDDQQVRSCLTIAMLAALGHDQELGAQVKTALRVGVRPKEIAEVLLHVAIYAGVPAANAAFRVAQPALAEAAADD